MILLWGNRLVRKSRTGNKDDSEVQRIIKKKNKKIKKFKNSKDFQKIKKKSKFQIL